MNERIKELAVQAGTYFGGGTIDYFGDYLPPYVSITNLNLEKFAELIVRECAGVCHTYGWGMLEHGRPGNSIADDCGVLIKEHFGVEK